MSHDPFDQLRNANPLPEESLPSAPMATAERIMRRGPGSARWPGWVTASAAAVAALMIGGGWMLWLGRGDTQVDAADPTTSVTATTTPATLMPTIEITVYLFTTTDTGPVVVPVPRTAVATRDPEGDLYVAAEGTMTALLDGPNTDEASRGLTTAIPDGIDGPQLSIHKVVTTSEGTIATVHIPFTWLDSGYPTSDGLSQIVFSLTAIDGIDGVDFALGDSRAPGGVVAGSMQLVPEDEFADYESIHFPATRLAFEGFMPLAFIETPAFGSEVALPATVAGVANSIGNQVRLTLEVDEMTLWQTTLEATCGTAWSACRGEWDWSTWTTTIPDIGYTGNAMLFAEVFGSGIEIIDRQGYPIVIASTAGNTATTTTMIDAVPAVPAELSVYLLIDADSTHTTEGPHLVPAAWPVAILSAPLIDPPRQAVEWLLQGPLPGWDESVTPVSTAIPEQSRVLDLQVADGVASVDLSSEFVSGGGSLSMRARIAQVVFTLTQFEEIDGVVFAIDGEPTTVFGGEGVIVDNPATRDGFDDLLPPIMIETPPYWSLEGVSPLLVSGTANVFEATVSLALTDNDGLILWEGFTTATCGTGCRGDWSIEIPYEVATDQLGAVIAWEESAQDGSQMNVREHPVWLRGSSEVPVCSGERVPADLPDQPDLPAPVAALRASIFQAARNCDWDELSGLIGPNTATSFGGPEDPIARWQEEELAGLDPMYWLASTLRLPSVQERIEVVDGPWIWPSASAYYWEDVPEADRQALLEIYREDDLGGFEDFGGFSMYRVGISPHGEWLFFVVGD